MLARALGRRAQQPNGDKLRAKAVKAWSALTTRIMPESKAQQPILFSQMPAKSGNELKYANIISDFLASLRR